MNKDKENVPEWNAEYLLKNWKGFIYSCISRVSSKSRIYWSNFITLDYDMKNIYTLYK